ncbi:MAG: RagB/SusD family nutrient uptake outer membrane protein [Dysgonamonadaceae bacterium]|jgi:hypothetical protein|nr:RagB/SusD family nutrient uptake outer membrane protein [Dysgonamonadaceae bacterium]
MKARYYKMKSYFIVPLLLLLIGGCNDFLDLKPESSIPPSTYWKTTGDAKNWMAGIYNQMQRTLQTNWYDWGEARSDNNDPLTSGTTQLVLVGNTFNSSESSTANVINWQQLYATILLCNTGIKYFPDMIRSDVDAVGYTFVDYLGQCYGMRALMYFYAVRLWGRVPLITEAIENSKDPMQFPRASIREVRDQIEADAFQAIEYLNPIENDNTRKYYITRDAMYALLTDLYATFQEYDKVIEISDLFTSTTKCAWIANANNWKLLFTDPVGSAATENILVMYWDYIEFGGSFGYAGRLGSAANTSSFKVRNNLFQKLLSRKKSDPSRSDARWWHCFDSIIYKSAITYEAQGTKLGKCMRWDGSQFIYDAAAQSNVRMPIYRYADVMTLRAEALALTGRRDEALTILQKLRSRVGYNPTYAEDPTNHQQYYDDLEFEGEDANTALQDAILDERQLEFLAEGKRWFDLCRVGKTIFTRPYYDNSYNGAQTPKPRISPDSYAYLRSHVNSTLLRRAGFPDMLDFEGDNINRILLPIISGAFTPNPYLRGDQNFPYDE